MTDDRLFRGVRTWLVALMLGGLLGLVAEAHAQGFMVKPMRVEVAPTPGQTIDIPVEIRNTAGEGVRNIELRLVELSQAADGGWRMIEPGSGEDLSSLHSSVPWSSLAASEIAIDPMHAGEALVHLNVPSNARGAYFAGLVAETPQPANAQGITVRVRFLIPLIVEIAGRPVRQQVALADVAMNRVAGVGATPSTTTAGLVIANEGRTFSRIKGKLSVERLNGDKWRLVTRLDLAERSIIPGVTLQLGSDLGRRLPSGTYRLKGELLVDGRRLPPLEKQIEFIGDPGADSMAYDTALVLEPEAVTMDVVPGATRTTTVTITNPGSDPVNVSMASSTPAGMVGVEAGKLRGIDLSAEPWTEIRPAEFTIRPGGRQKVRVISQIPKDGILHPNYYASLVLEGTYADGQSAGQTRSLLHLANAREASSQQGVVEQLALSEGASPTQYIVQARLANIGDVHIQPIARAFLLTAQNEQVRAVPLTGDEGMLLPLGKRTYGAELDFAGVEPGYYALRAVFSLGGDQEVAKQYVVLVETQQITGEDGRTISVPVVTLDPAQTGFPEVQTEPAQPIGSGG